MSDQGTLSWFYGYRVRNVESKTLSNFTMASAKEQSYVVEARGAKPVGIDCTSQSASIIEQSSYIAARAWISDVPGNFTVSVEFSKAAGCQGQTAMRLLSGGKVELERTLDGADRGSVDVKLFIDIQDAVEFQVESLEDEGCHRVEMRSALILEV